MKSAKIDEQLHIYLEFSFSLTYFNDINFPLLKEKFPDFSNAFK